MSAAPIVDVELYIPPWVSGTYAERYFGDVSVCLFWDHKKSWGEAHEMLLDALRAAALKIGANSVVGLEITIDPFCQRDGVSCVQAHATGKAAILRPL